MTDALDYLRWFENLALGDIPLVGGKNASLGELYRELAAQGIRVPNGFALTVRAYNECLQQAGAWAKLHALLDGLDVTDVETLSQHAAEAREIVYAATDSPKLQEQIGSAYRKLEAQYGAGVAVAVRSSATAEDLPTASFAGQHESYSNIQAPTICSRPAGSASPRSLPTARSSTGSITASITSRSHCRSGS